MPEFRYAWEYVVEPEHLAAFESAYRPDGDWARLFRRDPAYLGTDLLRDRRDPQRFVTIDRWTSYDACVRFRERNREAFEALDRRCEEYTSNERHLGDFDVVGVGAGSNGNRSERAPEMPVERWVALQVDDAESYRRYRAGMTPLLEACGGSFGYDFEIGAVLKSEADHPINRVFTIRFPDRQTMDAFFADQRYLKVRAEYFDPAVSGATTIALYERD